MINRYKSICKKIELYQEQIEEIKALRTGVSGLRYDEEKLKKTPSTEAPFSKYVLKLVSLEEKLSEELENLMNLKKEISGNERDQKLLYYRYFEGLSWKEIAYRFDVTVRTVLRWHQNLK